jgi:hypothetical protein
MDSTNSDNLSVPLSDGMRDFVQHDAKEPWMTREVVKYPAVLDDLFEHAAHISGDSQPRSLAKVSHKSPDSDD